MAKEVYVDEDYFDFSGLTVEADYFYWDPLPFNKNTGSYGTLLRDSKPLSVADVTWKILPSYEPAGGDCTGVLSFTVGEDFTKSVTYKKNAIYNSAGNLLAAYDPNAGAATPLYLDGVTSNVELQTVHIVKSIALKDPPNLGDYFYWEANDREAWKVRLGETSKLVVTYTDNTTNEPTIGELADKSSIWWNVKAEEGTAGTGNTTIKVSAAGSDDFDIIPITYPLTAKANPEGSYIVLYYRGAVKKVPVEVFTTLDHVDVVAKDPNGVRFDPDAARDNDFYEGEKGQRGLADLIIVKATYTTYNNSGATAEIPLRYKGYVYDDLLAGSVAGNAPLAYEPYYTFDKGAGNDATYQNGISKWSAAVKKDKEYTISRPVTIGHHVLEADFDSGAWSTPNVGFMVPDPGIPYTFADRPDFSQNLVWTAKDNAGNASTKGWKWLTNTARTSSPVTGSGIKQPAKAKTQPIDVEWVVKNKIE